MTPPGAAELVFITSPEQRAAAYAIRFDVFVTEQQVPAELELDDRDAEAEHVLALVDGEPQATGRLVVEPAGFEGVDPAAGPVAHLGRIAVRAAARGQGLGMAVMQALEVRARERGLHVAYLTGQLYAVPFYERLGYTPWGDEVEDAGIMHRHMSRPL